MRKKGGYLVNNFFFIYDLYIPNDVDRNKWDSFEAQFHLVIFCA